MNAARLDLCKELYDLSGWQMPRGQWSMIPAHDIDDLDTFGRFTEVPNYDLGLMLRKLPNGWRMRKSKQHDIYWAIYGNAPGRISISAETPEDAVCQLAIVLIKRGILT